MDLFAESSPRRRALPVAGQTGAERADAARNRQKILDAAARLIQRHGSTSLSLDEVAREAGVGVGTVYRRFGDRAGLVAAMVDDREVRFQIGFMSGPPPLGPGAPAPERIRAFLHALAERMDDQLDLLMLGESPGGPYHTGPYRLRHTHLVTLLNEAAPAADAHFLADALLAALMPALLHHQRRAQGYPLERVKAGMDQLLSLALA